MDEPRSKQSRVNEFLGELFGGAHHVRWEKVRYEPFEQFSYCFRQDCSTYDGSLLTRIVILAHVYRIRVEMMSAGRFLKLWMSARAVEGQMHERHPGIAALAENVSHYTEVGSAK